MSAPTYSYRYRPSFGLSYWMIEFCRGDEREELFTDFLSAIIELQPVVVGKHDLWPVGDAGVTVKIHNGEFSYSIDEWGSVFVDGKSDLLEQIHQILQRNEDFESLEVNIEDYKKRKE